MPAADILDVRQGTEGVSLLDLEPEYQRDVVWNRRALFYGTDKLYKLLIMYEQNRK